MSSAPTSGTLFLLPVGLDNPGDNPLDWQHWIPAETRQVACELRHFVAENAKTARLHLKTIGHPTPLRELAIRELPHGQDRMDKEQIQALLAPLREGSNLGLMSEAGCPAIADPGALLVRAAHAAGIKVKPLVGPSSLLLALMASGLDGQRFAFHGYLPVREPERSQTLQQLERESARHKQTQLFIETPYRNQALLDALLKHCKGSTRLCIACDLGLPDEIIRTDTIQGWQKQSLPALEKRPAVFLLLSGT